MSHQQDASQHVTQYPINPENIAEIARLVKQARLISEQIGLLPAELDLSRFHRLLDIGCGPGEWTLHMARLYPHLQVQGIDISQTMIAYARDSASYEGLSNVSFDVMDARAPLKLAEASLDLVHMRLATPFLTTSAWPQMLQECFRLLRPGGIICSTEMENMGTTTSAALAMCNHLGIEAYRAAGQCFSQHGDIYGITAVQARLLQQAGFKQLQQQVRLINYSAGMPAHRVMYENWQAGLKLFQPFALRMGVTTQQELDILYTRALSEMEQEDFCAVVFFQTTWGLK
ncbi:class I SAM-dependent methyltransferase [Ktedonosporobacter rubrisoli]|uniref:Class I SAM-dependent methyltransferase n=1 Tax=Ktedonosporobacter rubrisoli TaxID=2509675 RepID=A0A4P6JNR9_KTERU|nr:class I SAM-dependent methyltransferase [Ktedonosporobacter rubrisoli]QBD76823.1 class I SAM-dependent methyltransferase [Ktedonosporobacter rubrisoli]